MLQTTEFETHDRDEAIAAMSAMVSSELTLTGRGALRVKTHVVTSDVVAHARLTVGTEFRALNDPVDLIHIVTAGGLYVVDTGRAEHVVASGETIRPPTHLACRFVVPEGTFIVTTLPGQVVRDVARELFVDQPGALKSDALHPITPAMGELWRATRQLYCAQVLQPEIYHNVLLRQEATRALIATAILAFGLHTPPATVATTSLALRRACTYIEDHLAEPMTIHDIATTARLSVRALQYGFQDAYGISPMMYLRSARLSAVRKDLQLADATAGDSVATIARRWGFLHLGRFAGAYRDAYGETPRQTLGI